LSESKSPGWMRGAQVGLGAIVIILSILVLIHPGITVVSIIIIIAIILLFVGVEKILSGIFVANKSRWGSVGLGVLAIILALIALAFPIGTTVFVITLLAIALLFNGIAHVVHGVGNKESPGWARGFGIGAGVIAIALSILIMASPLYGAVLVSLILGIALLIIGIEIIVLAISGRRMQMMSSRTMER
jgi:uncharacterized membrane protein HdeD (DUF308 family)